MSPGEWILIINYYYFLIFYDRKQLISRGQGYHNISSPATAYAALQTSLSNLCSVTLFLSHCTIREAQTCDVSVRSAIAYIFFQSTFLIINNT